MGGFRLALLSVWTWFAVALPLMGQASTVIGWGLNTDGQATPPPGLSDAVAVAGGFRYSLAVRANGAIAGWGNSPLDPPIIPAGISNVVALFSRGGRNVAVLGNGTIRAWSFFEPDLAGQVPAGLSNVMAVAQEGLYFMALKINGTVVSWGGSHTNVPAGLSNVISIAAANNVSLAAKSDGNIVAWRSDGLKLNGFVPAGLSNVVAVAASHQEYCMALKSDGKVVTWGLSAGGVGPVPATLSNVVAMDADSLHALALSSDGTVTAWGANTFGESRVPSAATNVTAISAGFEHSLAIAHATIAPWPRITAQPQSVLKLVGDATIFSVTADAAAPLQYRWQFRGQDLVNQTNATLVLTDLAHNAAGDYAVVVSAAGLSVRSAPAFLVVNDPPVAIPVVTEGTEDTDLLVELDGIDPSNLPLVTRVVSLPLVGRLFQFDAGHRGAPIDSVPAIVTGHNVLIYAPAPDGNGAPYDQFLFTVANELGESSRAKAVLNVLPVNDPPVARAGADQVVECAGDATLVRLDGRASSDVDDTDLRFTWSEAGMLLGTNSLQEVLLPSGVHAITLEARDPSGASSKDDTIVRIADTTPPEIVCPNNIVVDFTGSTGAVVNFTVTATDTCSLTGISCLPSSGKTFPIGETPINCVALDSSSNKASCSFTVTVNGPFAIYKDVLTQLLSLNDGITNISDSEPLQSAIKELTSAIEPAFWRDQTHLVPRQGETVFQETKRVLQAFREIEDDDRVSMLVGAVQEFASRLAKAARLLAEVSIQEAAAAGANLKTLTEAEKRLAKGDAAMAASHPSAALEHYRLAWKAAIWFHGGYGNIQLTGTGVRLHFEGLPGQLYLIQASTNLLDWATVGIVSSDDGQVEFEDRDSSQREARYFRAVVP